MSEPGSAPGSHAWRRDQLVDLLRFAEGSVVERGFGWLDDDGVPDPSRGLPLWVNARMTYVFARAGRLDLAAHGVRALSGDFADDAHGGWFRELDADGRPTDDTKAAYEHAFVVLASAAATQAGVPEAEDLLGRALEVQLDRFWDDDAGAVREGWDRTWTTSEDYRGANSNMHTVEAYLAAARATGDAAWGQRAVRTCRRVLDVARDHEWRVVEHFDADWTPRPDLNADRVDDPFRPYGATPGHGFEWARLALEVAAAQPSPPSWLGAAAAGLFDRACTDTDDGVGGFCYTTDWSGEPIVRERFHWVLVEALQAADAVHGAIGDTRVADLGDAWWRLADEAYVDHERGSWHHELDEALRPSQRTWVGKPDAYHVFNALTSAST